MKLLLTNASTRSRTLDFIAAVIKHNEKRAQMRVTFPFYRNPNSHSIPTSNSGGFLETRQSRVHFQLFARTFRVVGADCARKGGYRREILGLRYFPENFRWISCTRFRSVPASIWRNKRGFKWIWMRRRTMPSRCVGVLRNLNIWIEFRKIYENFN